MKTINDWRMSFLAFGEITDALRLAPRLLVAAYAYLVYFVVMWYVGLTPYEIRECHPITSPTECIVVAPTTQQTTFVSIVVSIAGAVIGLYVNSGRKWDRGVVLWPNRRIKEDGDTDEEPPYIPPSIPQEVSMLTERTDDQANQ